MRWATEGYSYAVAVTGLVVAGRRTDARAVAGFVPDCIVLLSRLMSCPTSSRWRAKSTTQSLSPLSCVRHRPGPERSLSVIRRLAYGGHT